MKVKLIVGFRRDQEHSIDIEEAHKAYYLFLHPTERGIFKNGLAIKGDQIQEIVPDWHGTMGWNPSHQLDSDDWNELNTKGIAEKIKSLMAEAKDVAQFADVKELTRPLTAILAESKRQIPEHTGRTGMKSIKQLLEANK